MQKNIQFIIIFVWFFFAGKLQCYTLPPVGLGGSNFLDGGPLRQVPGWYWQSSLQFYHSNRFLDAQGDLLPLIKDPDLNTLQTAIQFIYLSRKKILGGNIGFDVTQPIALHVSINKDIPLFKSAGGGLGDLAAGIYLQWDPIMHGQRPIFIHRIELVGVFPTGKNKLLEKTINPGNRIYYFDPYWAATLYFTPRFTASWRLHYLWCGTNHITHIKPGQAIHFNYAVDYAMTERLIIGVNGYYLRQTTPSTFHGDDIPDSKERVFAIGPGFLWSFAQQYTFVLFGNLFFEMDVRNRPQGIRAIVRVLKHF